MWWWQGILYKELLIFFLRGMGEAIYTLVIFKDICRGPHQGMRELGLVRV